MDLFFVLSGYLIFGTIVKKTHFSPAKYALRRVQRIYPTFLAVFAVYLVLSIVFPGESKLPEGIAQIFIYIVQNLLLLPGIFDIDPIITVAWTLSYEVFYYLTIPVAVFAIGLKTMAAPKRLIFWGIVTLIALIGFSQATGHFRLVMFLCGIILFEIHTKTYGY